MYKEELMFLARETNDVETKKKLMEEAYLANFGLIMNLLRDAGMNQSNFDDFMQLSYIAFDKTVRVYKEDSGYSVLSYYRLCLKHECYKFWLAERNQTVSLTEIPLTNFDCVPDYKQFEVGYEVLELNEMNATLWRQIDSILSVENAQILHERFQQVHTLKAIGERMGITAESVRKRIIHSCDVLRSDSAIREVAQFYDYL